jgi:hypothetical protein
MSEEKLKKRELIGLKGVILAAMGAGITKNEELVNVIQKTCLKAFNKELENNSARDIVEHTAREMEGVHEILKDAPGMAAGHRAMIAAEGLAMAFPSQSNMKAAIHYFAEILDDETLSDNDAAEIAGNCQFMHRGVFLYHLAHMLALKRIVDEQVVGVLLEANRILFSGAHPTDDIRRVAEEAQRMASLEDADEDIGTMLPGQYLQFIAFTQMDQMDPPEEVILQTTQLLSREIYNNALTETQARALLDGILTD